MSTTQLTFSFRVGGVLTDVTSVVLRDAAATYGVKRTDTGATVVASGTAMTHASTGVYTYSFTDPAADLTYLWNAEFVYSGLTNHAQFTATGGTAAVVTGQIIDSTTLTAYLGSKNLAILSNQNDAATTADLPTVQQFINNAESAVFSVLLQLQCSGGTFFKYPFKISDVAIKSSGSLIALQVLQKVCHQYAAYDLNRWRMLLSTAEGEEGSTAVDSTVKRWKDQGDETLRRIIRWAQGYTDGQYVELDLNDGATVGQIYRTGTVTFAGATVGANGLPDVTIVNPVAPWLTVPSVVSE